MSISGTDVVAPVVLVANTSWYLYNFRFGTIAAIGEAGHRVVCVAPKDAYSRRLVDDLNVEYVEVSIAGADRGLLTELRTLLATVDLIRHLRPSYVFNFTIKANLYSGVACWLLNVPFANNISGLGTVFLHERRLYKLIRRGYVWINTRAEKLFFQNPVDLNLFREAGLTATVPVAILPGSGVDLARFPFRKMPNGPMRFVMVARLLGDKGVREYVEAARLIRQSNAEVEFVLVGPTGADNATAIGDDEVQTWVEQGIIDYRGELPDVTGVLTESHVFVLPSYREGMPKTVLEAAAMGRPAIVSDVPGCRQAIQPEVTGWLCQPRAVDSLVTVMNRVIRCDRDHLVAAGNSARKLAEERFSDRLVIDAYLKCLAK